MFILDHPSEERYATLASELKRIAGAGLQGVNPSLYTQLCSRYDQLTQTYVGFVRVHNGEWFADEERRDPRRAHWWQLTMIQRKNNFEPLPWRTEIEEGYLRAFFGMFRPMVLTCKATSDFGIRQGARHYRLFVDEQFKNPYMPTKDLKLSL
jgi:hypothetical protein